MTIRERMEQLLTNNGTFNDDAKAVMDSIVAACDADPLDKMHLRWGEDLSAFTQGQITTIWSATKKRADAWFAENAPDSPYRPRHLA